MEENTTPHVSDIGLQIIVLKNGWVYVGDVSKSKGDCFIRNAKNIRRWGTARGLGELALEGPKQNTKLDEAGFVTAPTESVLHFIKCAPSKWS